MTALQFTCDWTSHHFADWRRWLAPLIGRRAYGLEIGSLEGRSAVFFLTEILTDRHSNLICIDPWEYSEEHQILRGGIGTHVPQQFDLSAVKDRFLLNLAAAHVEHRAIVYAKSSRRAVPTLADSSLDFGYIDGSHLACRALEDAVLLWPKIKPGGILIWDDYHWNANAPPPPGWTVEALRPQLGIDSFLAVYQGQYEAMETSNAQVKIQKR